MFVSGTDRWAGVCLAILHMQETFIKAESQYRGVWEVVGALFGIVTPLFFLFR